MDKRELLKSVLQNFINDKPDEAKADFHQYLTLKSKEITGIGATPTAQENQTEVANDSTDDTQTHSANDAAAAAVASAEAATQGTE